MKTQRSRRNGAAEERSEEERLFRIYLQDHLALARAGVELANRVKAEHDEEWVQHITGRFLAAMLEDRKELLRIARAVGVEPSLAKEAGAWLGPRLGVLKLNGRLISRSPLTIVVELEGMSMLAAHSEGLWRSLATVADARTDLELDTGPRADAARELREEVLEVLASASARALTPRGEGSFDNVVGINQRGGPGANGDAASPS